MTNERYNELNGIEDMQLTDAEFNEGWHFCGEFDGLCRNSNDEVFKCQCNEFQNKQHDSHVCDYFFSIPIDAL